MYYVFDDREFLDNEDMNKQYKRKWCDAWSVDEILGDCDYCPVCGRPVSLLEWLEPRKIRLTAGKFPDRLTTWLNERLVVSERFVELYYAAGLTGILEFQPIEVVKTSGKHSTPPPNYFRAKIAYSRKVLEDSEQTIISGSARKTGEPCSLCNPFNSTCNAIYKLVLKEDESSDETNRDIFVVYSFGVVMSQRFFDFVQKHQFTNFKLIPENEYTWGTKYLKREEFG